jgi:glutathione synthase/RimK-type ligase-like ATP-grasp enzyme
VICMKTGWLLYDARDYEVNRLFAVHIAEAGRKFELEFQVVLTEDFEEAILNPPDFVISRQRNPLLSTRIEGMGIPVFNNAKVCELCNDKRKTHAFLEGFPLMETEYPVPGIAWTPKRYPVVIKPAFGHGGDRVALANDQAEVESALSAIFPEPALAQEVASDAGRDLRIYVLFGEIVAAVLRTARSGIVSNFKRGGGVKSHTVTKEERALAQAVIARFAAHGAPLCFAGIDLMVHHGRPVVNEVEDVVGSRMLYQVSDLDIIARYAERIAQAVTHDNSAEL